MNRGAACAHIDWAKGTICIDFRDLMALITVYGIPNCNTVKKARAWLGEQSAEHSFVDFKKAGVPADRLPVWSDAVGWDKLINRRGTTWRKLNAAEQVNACTPAGALAVALAMPSVIKRPVVEWGNSVVTAGFDAAQFAETLHRLRA
jgi:Spx/MgsR family transcriptional regulator